MTLARLRERVQAALGDGVFAADDGRYARDDGVEGPFVPGLVVRPRSAAEVAELGVPSGRIKVQHGGLDVQALALFCPPTDLRHPRAPGHDESACVRCRVARRRSHR